MNVRRLSAVAMMLFLAQVAPAAQFLVVTRSDAATWTVFEAEEIEINESDKVRTLAAGVPVPATFDAKALGRLAAVPLERCQIIRRASDGTWLAQIGAVSQWQTLLPDGLKGKAAGAAADLWKSSVLNVRKTRKDKAGEAVPIEMVYAIVPGQNTSASALTLATSLAPHGVPGTTEKDTFSAMAALMPAVVKTWPTGPVADKVREEMRSMLTEKLETWMAGDAERWTLDQALLLSSSAEAAFADDAGLAELRKKSAAAVAWLNRRTAILGALNEGRQSDAFVLAYREFEPFDRSSPDLAKARAEHLKTSADVHIAMAERLRTASDYAGAVRNLRIAQMRNPQRSDATNLLEQVRLEVARITAEQFAQRRRDPDPRSPVQVQLQRRLRLIEQYLADGKYADADAAIKDAETIDKDEPRIRFLQAQMEVGRGDLGTALAVLDLYAGMAITPQDFAEGEKLRAKVLYDIQTMRKNRKAELTTLASNERFATALQQAADGLKVDNEEPSFLFEAGVNACILRQCRNAGPLLKRFLDLTDSTSGERKQRISALRLLARTQNTNSAPLFAAGKDMPASWFSGAPLEPGVFYDPVSLMFQPKVSQIKASDHLTVQYTWTGGQLKAVNAKYEDKKTGSNVASLVTGLAITGSATWRTADRETNDFYFNYYDDVPQVLSVNHDNQTVRSAKTRIGVPAIGLSLMGGFGAMGALGGLGNLRTLGSMGSLGNMNQLRELANMAGMNGMGGFGGLGGLSNMPAMNDLRALRDMGAAYNSASQYASLARTMLDARSSLISTGQTYSVHSDPTGSTSKSGLVTLWNSPRIDTELAELVRGKRVAVGFSGNPYFHPFVWTGIHLFEFSYDSLGRVKQAREMDRPDAPVLDFSWEGKRLQSITARDKTGATTYSRRMTYNGDKLVNETITFSGKQTKIEYKYDKNGRMVESKCDEDASLDNRSRTVEFLADATPARRQK